MNTKLKKFRVILYDAQGNILCSACEYETCKADAILTILKATKKLPYHKDIFSIVSHYELE